MFLFSTSPQKKARTQAIRLVEVAKTVWNCRRDLLTSAEIGDLSQRRDALAALISSRAEADALNKGSEVLDAILRRIGGLYYPRGATAENVEFFLVASIVILGLRGFFIQPMVIPTNSMWPTYYGLTAENFPQGTTAPGILSRLGRFAAFGAVREEIDAPVSGEVSVPVVLDGTGQPHLLPATVDGRKWLVLPDKQSEYTLYVGESAAKIRLPADFHDFDKVVWDTFFPKEHPFHEQWDLMAHGGRLRRVSVDAGQGRSYYVYLLPTGRSVNAGDALVLFDVMKGDMVFVDRVSYQFVPPRVGSAFVFETGHIPGFMALGFPDEYLIKRIAGKSGDNLEIRPPVLYRNGSPADGAVAFAANAQQVAPYGGYLNAPEGRGIYLLPGQLAVVPDHMYMALGDNSAISEDSRYWGFVPEKEVIGRPLFIYYPFTRRWGLAR
jgi:signal peptidase I